MITRDEFMAYCEPVTESGCWIWTHGYLSSGYGRIMVDGRRWKAPRLAYTLFKGAIPEGLDICHHCDNPACVNPAHLFSGTERDNVRDCMAKGRWVTPKGERNSHCKLTETQVREIADMSGPATEVGRRYGVSGVMVGNIRKRKSWTHLWSAA